MRLPNNAIAVTSAPIASSEPSTPTNTASSELRGSVRVRVGFDALRSRRTALTVRGMTSGPRTTPSTAHGYTAWPRRPMTTAATTPMKAQGRKNATSTPVADMALLPRPHVRGAESHRYVVRVHAIPDLYRHPLSVLRSVSTIGCPWKGRGMDLVLVGDDGSDDAAVAIAWASRFAIERDLELVSVHVSGTDQQVEPPVRDFRSVVRDGHPVVAILEAAHDLSADLIVLGRRGRGGFRELPMGGIANQVAAMSPLPVVVVPVVDLAGADALLRQVVVGIDGLPETSDAAVWATRNCSEAHFTAVHALELAPAFSHLGDEPGVERLYDRAMARATERMRERWCRPFVDAGVPFDSVVEEGGAVEVLLAAVTRDRRGPCRREPPRPPSPKRHSRWSRSTRPRVRIMRRRHGSVALLGATSDTSGTSSAAARTLVGAWRGRTRDPGGPAARFVSDARPRGPTGRRSLIGRYALPRKACRTCPSFAGRTPGNHMSRCPTVE